MARMLPGEAELVSEWTGLPGEAKSVNRFERSNGLRYVKTTYYGISVAYDWIMSYLCERKQYV